MFLPDTGVMLSYKTTATEINDVARGGKIYCVQNTQTILKDMAQQGGGVRGGILIGTK
jgi:hypothetical protein